MSYNTAMPTVLKITLENDWVLEFDIIKNAITDLWLQRMDQRAQWPMDDHTRFYHFDSIEVEQSRAQRYLLDCIDTINAHSAIIEKTFTSVQDQDLLNYLHSIFERYHGQLDQQHGEFWQQCPDHVRQALANLNLAVHRCESLRHRRPRFVCTWFGMPKQHRLPQCLQRQHGTWQTDWGGVYLNYVEIGKTLRDMALDHDHYMADEMFQPFDHYSADFVVNFFDHDAAGVARERALMQTYLDSRRDFFQARGIHSIDQVDAAALKFKLAQLRYTDRDRVMQCIQECQHIKQVHIE